MERYLTVVPHSGYYCSVHDQELESQLEQLFSDRATGCDINYDLVNLASEKMSWRAVYTDYSEDYVENFGIAFDVALEFESMSSPREYNFSSDITYAYITESSLLSVYQRVAKEVLDKTAKEMFTSYDGFISFYSSNVSTWGPVTEWDHNQILCLLRSLADDVTGGFDQQGEYELGEASSGNGVYENLLYKHCPGIERLLRIRDYLEARKWRKVETV